MPNYQVQIILKTTSGVSADFVTNTWSILADDVSALEDAGIAIRAFYNGTGDRFSNLLSQTGHTLKAYDRADPEPRAPVLEFDWNLTPTPSGSPLPPEVSLCVSFQGDKESGVSQARKRGRIYFPMISATQLDTNGRPTAAFITDLATNAGTLLAASDAAVDWKWHVFSSVTGDSFRVTNGWVDNEWDIQRRRGRKPTSRTTFT